MIKLLRFFVTHVINARENKRGVTYDLWPLPELAWNRTRVWVYYIRANDMSSKRYTIAMYTVPIARSHIYFRNVVAKLSRRFLARGVFQNAIIPAEAVCDAVCIFYLACVRSAVIFLLFIYRVILSNVNTYFLEQY